MKTACLYLRVSTTSQTVENQRRELMAYCERMNWKVGKVYEDAGISGNNFDRPALHEMLQDAMKGKFDIVCVYSVCRLGRSTLDLLTVLKQLQDYQVGFCAVSQGLDSTTSSGRMLASFLSILAQWERELIIERVKAGMSRAKAQGVKIGRPRIAIDLKTALKLRHEGLGYKQVARVMNIPRTTLYRTLQAIPKTRVA